MLRAFSTAATGMSAQEQIVNAIANNLANVNTTGFKKSHMDFHDLMYIHLKKPGTRTDETSLSPTGLEIGGGVKAASTLKVFTAGELENTGRPMDLAILGDGFFQVTMPDGSTQYTRDGSIRIDANGSMVTSGGYMLEPSITIPPDWKSLNIGKDGTVTVNSAGTLTEVGQINLAKFPNPSGLSSMGGNLYAETPASGTPTTGTPGQSGIGALEQGFLEKSNVQMATELVKLITAQRAYEVNAKAIKSGNDMLQSANQILR